jgi:glucose/arabinose dehydrogenase
MRRALVCLIPLAGLLGLPAAATEPAAKPYGIDQRVPWTTSRVVGSPNPPPYRVVRTFPRLKVPTPIAIARQPGSDLLVIIHQTYAWGGAGRILRIKDDPNVEKAEQLLALDGIAYGMAFHPRFATNGYFYVGDNGPMEGGPKKTRVTRYHMDPRPPYRVDPKSAKVVLAWESDGHNGGDLAFGNDGMLYVSSGDGTSDSDTNLAGQDMTRLLSKVLRIDVDHPAPGQAYAVPPDNPFVKTPGVRPETWAYGFRNPWRLHIDRETGDLWVGQNGQDLWEQAYLVQKGANYGWSVTEGSHPFYPDRKRGPTPILPPTVEHPHSEMRSLTGGVVYHGTQLPELRGAYLYGDWSTGKIWAVRHQGGRVTWQKELASTTLAITGFGIDSHGELLIADHGGGAFYRLEPAPKEAAGPGFPTRLSETGLFTSVKGHRTHPALIPYSVNAPLWSDGAEKERFLALPGLGQIDFTTAGGWNFPEGTVLVKTFALDREAGNPASRRRIETRLLTRQQGQWYGYSYLWNDAQTDADLVPAAGADRAYEVADPKAPGSQRKQTWHYPSRAECMVCHSRAANFVLGPSLVQMNKVHDYGGVQDNQLRTLEHLGVFRVNWLDHLTDAEGQFHRAADALGGAARRPLDALSRLPPDLTLPARLSVEELRRGLPGLPKGAAGTWLHPVERLEQKLRDEPSLTTLLPRPPADFPRLVNPSDGGADLEARARSYLHANCAMCHVMAGGGNAQMELDVTTPRGQMKVIGVKPLHDTFGIAGARLIVPGDPERSLLYLRMKRRGPGQMPPLATSEVDEAAVKLMHDWIARMK